jgi:hypothetical protein
VGWVSEALPIGGADVERIGRKHFFFEKKKQKTFADCCVREAACHTIQSIYKS